MISWNFFNRASISGTSKPAFIASCKVCTVQGNDGSSKSLIASCWLEALSAIIAVTLFVMLYCLKTLLSCSEMLRPVCALSPNGSVSNTTLFWLLSSSPSGSSINRKVKTLLRLKQILSALNAYFFFCCMKLGDIVNNCFSRWYFCSWVTLYRYIAGNHHLRQSKSAANQWWSILRWTGERWNRSVILRKPSWSRMETNC